MKKFIRMITIFSLLITLAGCNKNELKDEKIKTSKRDELDLIALLEPKPFSSSSETAIHQYQFVFKDKKKSFPTESSIVNEVSLGNKSIVILNTQNVDDKFIVLDYEKKQKQWILKTIASLDVKNGHYFNEKEGIKLPIDSFVVNIGHEDSYSIWAFANKQKIIVIAMYDQLSFTPTNNLKTIKTNGKVFFISGKEKNKYLYYYDSEKLIVISGNIQTEEMVKLAKSLPPVISEDFPAK